MRLRLPYVLSGGAFLVRFLNIFLIFERNFVIYYLEYLGVRDEYFTLHMLIYLALGITSLLFVGRLIYSILVLWKWNQGLIMFCYIKVTVFILSHSFLTYTFICLVLSILGGCYDVCIEGLHIHTPDPDVSDACASSVTTPVINNSVLDIAPGYYSVSDTQYYDLLMKEGILPISDGMVGLVDSHHIIQDSAQVLEVHVVPEDVSFVHETPSTSVGCIDSDEFINQIAEWGYKHAPRKRWMGKSYGVSSNQLANVMEKLIGKKYSDQWLNVRDKDSYIKIIRKAYDLYNREGPSTRPPKVRRRRRN